MSSVSCSRNNQRSPQVLFFALKLPFCLSLQSHQLPVASEIRISGERATQVLEQHVTCILKKIKTASS